MTVRTPSIRDFLARKGAGARGRALAEIWTFDDHRIETIHDFIQWVFPLDKPSRAVPSSPVLTVADISAIRACETARDSLRRSAGWYLGFLTRNPHWLVGRNHNHLRISRAIQSLRLLAGDEQADGFRDHVIALARPSTSTMSGPVRFWQAL